MELNSLYVAVSNQLNVAKKEAKQFPSTFFEQQLIIAEELVEKVQTALYDECRILDEAVAASREERVLDLELEIEVLESERNYYASRGDWDYCELINEKLEEVKEKISKYN
jgi:hypothetical protein